MNAAKKIYLENEYNEIMERIIIGDNITVLRLGDGEKSLMCGKMISAQEGWNAPNAKTKLGESLVECLQDINYDNIYVGISCPCCDREAYYWYVSRLKNPNITFANLFVNVNYKRFTNDFLKIKRDAVVIGNINGENKKIGNLNILKYYPVSNQCVDFWETKAEFLIKDIIERFGEQNNLLYVFAAGPLSEPIIMKLYHNNPHNTYIDFGSCIDKYIHEKDTRPYTNPESIYGSRNCWMYNLRQVSFDVAVVLTTYKKPDALAKQLRAIKNQTLKPKQLILYQDGIDGEYTIDFKNEILHEFDLTFISRENNGVWKRFEIAKNNSKAPYVCVFDDDTIPGSRWLENCHAHMIQREAVYGTIGIVLEKPENYPYGGYYRVGWDAPNKKSVIVDFVGHSWFMKKEHLEYMFEGTEIYQSYKLAAEDMCLSYQCKKRGIPTIVPPHPYEDFALWGSEKNTAMQFGRADGAISMNPENCKRMQEVVRRLVNNGWKLAKEEINIKANKRMIKFYTYKQLIKRILQKFKLKKK